MTKPFELSDSEQILRGMCSLFVSSYNTRMATVERFSALSSSDFRLFWFGQLISLSGSWMQSVAQAWLVYSLTKSPFYLGLVAAAGSLPILLFSLLGGIVADRIRKRNLLLITQALSIIPAILLGILTGTNLITVWHVALIATFLGTVNAFDIPARHLRVRTWVCCSVTKMMTNDD